VSFVKLWIIAAFAVLLLCAPSSFAATQASAPKKDAPAPPAATAPTATTTADEPTKGESGVAALAILAGVAIAIAVVVFVWHAHDIQARLATATIARGGTVDTAAIPAAGGEELAAADAKAIKIDGPDAVAVGSAGEFKVEKAVANPVWSVTGLGSFTQLLKDDGRTFVFTPHERKDGVEIHVTAGEEKGQRAVKILAAAKASFVFRVAVRNWGLVVVAVFIVAGAIAMGVTGHLDGGNFVALVAPLAALLGIATATGDRGGGGGSAGGGTSGGGSGGGSAGS
jgi:hypothetical protein